MAESGAPDEFRSKPLWAQALVLVSGVVMNFIFGFILLVIGFLWGIPATPNILGRLQEKGPAEVHGLQTGDRVLAINGDRIYDFDDIIEYVAYRSPEPLTFRVKRPRPDGEAETMEIRVVGQREESVRGGVTMIGATPPFSRKVGGILGGVEYAGLREALQPGDEILAVGETAIPENHGHLVQEAARPLAGRRVALRVRRAGSETIETVHAPVVSRDLYDTGIRMAMAVAAVTPGSPAAEAGLAPGDEIEAILEDGRALHFESDQDFIRRIRARALRPTPFRIRRGGAERVVTIEPSPMPGDPRIPENGDTYLGVRVEAVPGEGFEVTEVLPDGPGSAALEEGDLLVKAGERLLDPEAPLGPQVDAASSAPVTLRVRNAGQDETVTLTMRPRVDPVAHRPLIGIALRYGRILATGEGPYGMNWDLVDLSGAHFIGFAYTADLATTIIHVRTNGETLQLMNDTPQAILEDPLAAGLEGTLPLTMAIQREPVRADTVPAALALAGRTWVDMAMSIYNLFYRLATRDVRMTAVGGPIAIFDIISRASAMGLGTLLRWVALISINLGILNLLPFPALDGGHLLFTLIEWIKGSPPSPFVREVAQYVGVLCLLGLILTVSSFDVFYWLTGG
jgi:regulator of sigma E protease